MLPGTYMYDISMLEALSPLPFALLLKPPRFGPPSR